MAEQEPQGAKKPAKGDDASGPRQPKGLIIWLIITFFVIVMFFLGRQNLPSRGRQRLPLHQFYAKLDAGKVKTIRIEENLVEGEEASGETFHFKLPRDSIGNLIDQLCEFNKSAKDREHAEIAFKYEEPNRLWTNLLLTIGPWFLIIGFLWFFVFRQFRAPGGPGGVLSFGKSRARLASKETTSVTFNDVAGIDEAREEVTEIIEFLKNPEKFQRLGGRIPKGVLLVGAPGTGKTLLAKAIAGEAAVPFFNISGSDFVEMFVGVGASRVRDLFKNAKENSPCIVFLDEVDAVGRRRGTGLGGGHDEREQTLNAILVEMDGFESDSEVILIAATNRPDVLDPALLRPGRFDREIVVDLPDVKGRHAILEVHARKRKMAPAIELERIARGTPSFSGADLENLINEAALLAVLKGQDSVRLEDLEEARDKVKWGRAKRSKVMAEEEKRIIAYHEGGHAIAATLLPDAEPLHKVTIIPRGMALGATMHLPKQDTYLQQKRKILATVTTMLAGRACEEAFCDDVTSGAQNDFEQATEMARLMVCKWGMSETLGPLNYSENEEHLFLGREVTKVKSLSEATAVEIDKEIRKIIDACHQEARRLISAHKKEIEKIVEALLTYEVLDSDDLDAIMRGEAVTKKPLAPPPPSEPEPAPPVLAEAPATPPSSEGDPPTPLAQS